MTLTTTTTPIRPANQKRRIATLRLAFAALLPMILFTQSRWIAVPAVADLLETLGILAILAAVLGRFWAILYIGGRKNAAVMRDGPYSVSRHPLYLFSTIGAAGFGLMLESVTLAAILGGTAWLILSLTAAREEHFLRNTFGGDYDSYARQVPRMLPAWRLFRTSPRVSVEIGTLARNAADALVFVGLIPMAELLKWVASLHALPAVSLF